MIDTHEFKTNVENENVGKLAETFRPKIEQSASLLSNLHDASICCKIVVNKEGKPIDWFFLHVNEAYERTAKLKKEQILGKKVTDLYPDEQKDPANRLAKFGCVALTREPTRFESYMQAWKKWVNVFSYSPQKGYFIAIFEDITERKNAENALKESEEKFKNLAEELPNMIFINYQGRVVYANKKCEEITGYTRADFYSPDFKFISLIVPQDVEVLKSAFARHMRGEAVPPYEYGLLTKKGKRIEAIITTKLIEYEGGKAILGIITDITERKKAEQELLQIKKDLELQVEARSEGFRRSEQRYRELYESFDEAFIATDWEFNIIHWNKAAERVTRVNVKDALGKKIYDVLPEMTSVDIGPYLEALQKKKPTRFMMNTISRETGREAIFEISTYPSTLGIVIIVEDKTELEAIKRLSAIGQVAGMVGHDIRNPLQAITGDVYLAKLDLALIPESEEKNSLLETISAIDKNVDYISKIVADLQDYARPLKPAVEETDLKRIIEELLEKNVLSDNYIVSINVESDARKVMTDPGFINRIMYNLITNAVQAMPNGGKLTINANKEANDVVITVKDTGVGIPKEIKEKLFTPLFTTKARGQGFGLVVIKRMTEALGGTVTFDSYAGKGTTFMIRLPSQNSVHQKK